MAQLILIVEDEAPQAEMLRYNFEKDGFRTRGSHNWGRGLVPCRNGSPGLGRGGLDDARAFWHRSLPRLAG